MARAVFGGVTAGILAIILLIPAARDLFAFGPLHGDDVAVAITAGIAALVLLDVLKRIVGPTARRREFKSPLRLASSR